MQPNDPVTILQELLQTYPNTHKIKKIIKQAVVCRQNMAYTAMVYSPLEYLYAYGLQNHSSDLFHYIQTLLKRATDSLAVNLIQGNTILKKEVVQSPLEMHGQEIKLYQENQHNINIDSALFGSHYSDYWSLNNPITLETQKYIRKIQKKSATARKVVEEKNYATQLAKLSKQEKKEKQKQLLQQEQKKARYLQISKNIQHRKQSQLQRQRQLNERLIIQKNKKMLIPKETTNCAREIYEVPLLKDKKKLLKLRLLGRSAQLKGIQSQKSGQSHLNASLSQKPIFNQAPKVSFKSRFYKLLAQRQHSQISNKSASLYQKRMAYSRTVLDNHRPTIDAYLVKQIKERIKPLARRRLRRHKEANNLSKQSEQDSRQAHQVYSDEDQEIQIKSPKENQDEFTAHNRYQLGMEYLQYVRSLPKKKSSDSAQTASNALTARPQYKNYLEEIYSKKKVVSSMESGYIKLQLNLDGKNLKDPNKKEELVNHVRRAQQKARYAEQLARYGSIQNMVQKVQVDNMMLQAIKGRLALMNQQ